MKPHDSTGGGRISVLDSAAAVEQQLQTAKQRALVALGLSQAEAPAEYTEDWREWVQSKGAIGGAVQAKVATTVKNEYTWVREGGGGKVAEAVVENGKLKNFYASSGANRIGANDLDWLREIHGIIGSFLKSVGG